MKSSVRLKGGTYCKLSITSPTATHPLPFVIPDIRSQFDGSTGCRISPCVHGTAGKPQAMLDHPPQHPFSGPSHRTASCQSRHCMIRGHVRLFFTGHRSPQVPRSAAATLCPPYQQGQSAPGISWFPPSFAGQYPAGFPGDNRCPVPCSRRHQNDRVVFLLRLPELASSAVLKRAERAF